MVNFSKACCIIISASLSKAEVASSSMRIAGFFKNANGIVVLTDQGIKEKGSHNELIARDGLYAKLYNAQFRGFIPDEIE